MGFSVNSLMLLCCSRVSLHTGMAEARERAVQRYSRHGALAHVGICGPSDGPYNEHDTELVWDWEHTYEKILTQQQREVQGLLGHCRLDLTMSHVFSLLVVCTHSRLIVTGNILLERGELRKCACRPSWTTLASNMLTS